MGDNQGTQTFHRQVLAVFLAGIALAGLYFRDHSHVGSLDVEHQFLALSVTHDDAHALGLRLEREILQDVIFFKITTRVLQLDIGLVPVNQHHSHLFGKLDQSDFVWRTGLELLLVWVTFVGVDWRDVVAKTESKDQIANNVLLLAALETTLLASLFLWIVLGSVFGLDVTKRSL